ncbi:hypothetical protein VPH49_24670 [Pseudomonas luteola]|uniref:hypothetical protein n=1 Tax=Pseudomonas luteola TaxID=47886 RepID=UPI0012384E86|nr:hypothetical protein [Pseudomonas luteola]QEU26316.1 hypothetical protein FOB45_00405 [Pseudomonas luteola]
MKCLICAHDAELVPGPVGWYDCSCGQCGRYRILQTLVSALMDEGQIFDVPQMRFTLQTLRRNGAIPSIGFDEARLYQRSALIHQ